MKYREIINYLICGFLTTLFSLFSYFIVTITILDVNISIELQIANVFSWCVGVLFAYFSNRKFVFKSTNNKQKEFPAFVGSRITTLLIDMLIMHIFVTVLGYNDKVFKLISQIIVIIGNYLLGKLIVFKKDNYEKNNK